MPGVWNLSSNLGTVDEYAPFSHSLTYTNAELGGTYRVSITPSLGNDTVSIAGNNISGYYTNVFNVEIKYKTKAAPTNEYITVNNFRNIDQDKLEQVVSYKPDLTPSITYTYTAKAYDVSTGVLTETLDFTKTVNNNWDLNKALLIQYVNSTVVTDPSMFKPWINSINGAVVLWRNTKNLEIPWA